VGIAVLSFLPAIPTLLAVVFDAIALREFGRIYYVRPKLRHYVALVLGTFPYQLVLAAAAVRAVWRESRGERGWEKTEHVGAHRRPDAATTEAPAGAARAYDRLADCRDDDLDGSFPADPYPDEPALAYAAKPRPARIPEDPA